MRQTDNWRTTIIKTGGSPNRLEESGQNQASKLEWSICRSRVESVGDAFVVLSLTQIFYLHFPESNILYTLHLRTGGKHRCWSVGAAHTYPLHLAIELCTSRLRVSLPRPYHCIMERWLGELKKQNYEDKRFTNALSAPNARRWR